MLSIVFCAWCALPPWQWLHSQWQSRATKYHDNTNINPENTKIHGSIQCGTIWKCAASGAISPINDNAIGNPQQKTCGKIDAAIPIFTALFFMMRYYIRVWLICKWKKDGKNPICCVRQQNWCPHQDSLDTRLCVCAALVRRERRCACSCRRRCRTCRDCVAFNRFIVLFGPPTKLASPPGLEPGFNS